MSIAYYVIRIKIMDTAVSVCSMRKIHGFTYVSSYVCLRNHCGVIATKVSSRIVEDVSAVF